MIKQWILKTPGRNLVILILVIVGSLFYNIYFNSPNVKFKKIVSKVERVKEFDLIDYDITKTKSTVKPLIGTLSYSGFTLITTHKFYYKQGKWYWYKGFIKFNDGQIKPENKEPAWLMMK